MYRIQMCRVNFPVPRDCVSEKADGPKNEVPKDLSREDHSRLSEAALESESEFLELMLKAYEGGDVSKEYGSKPTRGDALRQIVEHYPALFDGLCDKIASIDIMNVMEDFGVIRDLISQANALARVLKGNGYGRMLGNDDIFILRAAGATGNEDVEAMILLEYQERSDSADASLIEERIQEIGARRTEAEAKRLQEWEDNAPQRLGQESYDFHSQLSDGDLKEAAQSLIGLEINPFLDASTANSAVSHLYDVYKSGTLDDGGERRVRGMLRNFSEGVAGKDVLSDASNEMITEILGEKKIIPGGGGMIFMDP